MTRSKTLEDTIPEGAVLRVNVGKTSLADSLHQAGQAIQAAQAGSDFEPSFSVGFEEIGQMLAVFTPKRLDAVAALRAIGPSSVRALAQHLHRDYKNVHGDVAALEQWMAVQRTEDGRVWVPWQEIVIDVRLPERAAA